MNDSEYLDRIIKIESYFSERLDLLNKNVEDMVFKINCYRGIEDGVFGEPHNTWYTYRGLGKSIYDLRGRVSDDRIVSVINEGKKRFIVESGEEDLSYEILLKKHLCHEVYDCMEESLEDLLDEIKKNSVDEKRTH